MRLLYAERCSVIHHEAKQSKITAIHVWASAYAVSTRPNKIFHRWIDHKGRLTNDETA